LIATGAIDLLFSSTISNNQILAQVYRNQGNGNLLAPYSLLESQVRSLRVIMTMTAGPTSFCPATRHQAAYQQFTIITVTEHLLAATPTWKAFPSGKQPGVIMIMMDDWTCCLQGRALALFAGFTTMSYPSRTQFPAPPSALSVFGKFKLGEFFLGCWIRCSKQNRGVELQSASRNYTGRDRYRLPF